MPRVERLKIERGLLDVVKDRDALLEVLREPWESEPEPGSVPARLAAMKDCIQGNCGLLRE